MLCSKAALLAFILCVTAFAGDVLVANYDQSQTGSNLNESVLTPANVATPAFSRVGAWQVSGLIFAHPLLIHNVTVNGVIHDLLIIATMSNNVYAFDAQKPGSNPVWSVMESAFAAPMQTTQTFYGYIVGCLSTPAADVASHSLFIVCATSAPSWVLRKIDYTNGSVTASITITGQVVGTGEVGFNESVGGMLSFNPSEHFQRTGLTIANGNVYFGFASHDDIMPWHGWMFSYNISTLTQSAIWCASPNGYGGGIWQSGGAPAVDSSGNIYVTTGNGTQYDGSSSWTDSVIKFSSSLVIQDWFTPSDNVAVNNADSDLASNRPMLTSGNQVVAFGKDFHVYVVNQNCMGHLQGSGLCTGLQTWQISAAPIGQATGSYGGLLLSGNVYVPLTTGPVSGFSSTASTFNTTAFASSATTYAFPGMAGISASADGSNSGIIWTVTVSTDSEENLENGTFQALDATTLTPVFTDSTIGYAAKFVPPVVDNGSVYVATDAGFVFKYALSQTPAQTTPARTSNVILP